MSLKLRRVTVGLLASCFLFAYSAGGSPDTESEPSFEGVYYSLDQTSGKLIALERAVAVHHFKHGKIAGAKSFYKVPGEESPIRFKSSQELAFVVRVPG